MIVYTLTHDHKYGTSTYLFKSDREDLEDEVWGGMDEGGEPKSIDYATQQVIDQLGVDFEPDNEYESISIEKQGEPTLIIL